MKQHSFAIAVKEIDFSEQGDEMGGNIIQTPSGKVLYIVKDTYKSGYCLGLEVKTSEAGLVPDPNSKDHLVKVYKRWKSVYKIVRSRDDLFKYRLFKMTKKIKDYWKSGKKLESCNDYLAVGDSK